MSAFETLQDIVSQGFCMGCGLCKDLAPSGAIEMRRSPNGQIRPVATRPIAPEEDAAIMRLCPGINVVGPFDGISNGADPVWGQAKRIARGYAADPVLRHRASTGGIMTAINRYLLESNRVAFILQVVPDPADAFGSIPVAVSDADALVVGAESRYAACSPLAGFDAILRRGEPFAVSLKPCDIAAINNLKQEDARARELIVFTMTMFCGTVPNLESTLGFFHRRGVDPNREAVKEFHWRGYGCPGPTRATMADGRTFEGTYNELWTDNPWTTQFRCKICPDAVGLQADLAVGDAWEGAVPLGEDEGWNALIAHTDLAVDVLATCEREKRIVLHESTMDYLNQIQPHHVRLRQHLQARLAGAMTAGLPSPRFEKLALTECSAGIDAETLASSYRGALERVRRGHGDETMVADYGAAQGATMRMS